MESTTQNQSQGRRAAVNALAVVGFIALVLVGVLLAVYTARKLPELSSRLGGASVSLSSIFHRNGDEPELNVVTSTTTIPFDDATTTPATTTTPAKPAVRPGTPSYITVTVPKPVSLYGDPDLTVRITDVGYLRRDGDTDTFVSSHNVPRGKDSAVKFTVTNVGTNRSGSWKFEADVPTSPSQDFTSPTQDSLGPGDRVDYVLGFEKGRRGDDREITITVDSKDTVDESNERNNEDSETIDIED
jgi:hypothetical protein